MIAPFPYFGGKSRIAARIWEAFGNVDNFVEPFAGSAAVLLARPDTHEWWNRRETVNDADGMISNYWRATQAEPDTVAKWADWIVSENDLTARHGWLVARRDSLQTQLEGDPDYYDAKVAGWWLWGICIWIGGGWCSGQGPWHQENGLLVNEAERGQGVERKRPHLSNAGRGINRKLPHLSDAGQGINRQLPHLGDAGRGINRRRPHLGGVWSIGVGINKGAVDVGTDGVGHCAAWSEHLQDMMGRLSDRLRRVRVCCGDWSRVCGPSPTTKLGLTGVFLDPPYAHAERDSSLYRVEMQTADAVREWAVAHGNDPLMRIAYCSYEGVDDMPADWTAFRWKAKGGYASLGDGSNDNATREVVYFSSHCLQPTIQAKLDLPMDAGVKCT